jgi:outer membrane lipoprotein
MKFWLMICGLGFVTGCASTVPEPIRNPPPDDIPIAAVQRTPDVYRNAPVRWGGRVSSVKNLKDETQIEVISRQLDGRGRPQNDSDGNGRFLIKIPGFVDPAVYESGREVTVSGRVDGTVEQTIGEFPYKYPVVRSDQIYLWERPPAPRTYTAHPAYYDPFWPSYWHHPFYPLGYPYYRPYYRPLLIH